MEELENCDLCYGLGVIYDEDNEEYIPCPNNCEDKVVEEDPLLNDKALFPDDLPEENKEKWND